MGRLAYTPVTPPRPRHFTEAVAQQRPPMTQQQPIYDVSNGRRAQGGDRQPVRGGINPHGRDPGLGAQEFRQVRHPVVPARIHRLHPANLRAWLRHRQFQLLGRGAALFVGRSRMIGLRDDQDSAPPPPCRAPELAQKIFAEDGWLASGLGLSHRPEQAAMARAVADALKTDEPLLFEAGTGVGKSLAYLIPGIIHAVDQTRQLIVSTHTISLQEQLEESDLPKCRRLFQQTPRLSAYAGFRSAVLVGKGNYLCTTRVGHALADRGTLLADAEHDELQRISEWAGQTSTGLRHELRPPPQPEVWDLVNADSSSCSRKHCDCEKCFFQRAKARIRSAQVIIVNHALLFALINAGGARAEDTRKDARGVLFADDFVVLDEAHTVPEVATEHFGLSLSSYGVDRALRQLFNPRTKRGQLGRLGGAEGQQLVEHALNASRQFFEARSEEHTSELQSH